MSAERLREAADRLEALAEAATPPDRWSLDDCAVRIEYLRYFTAVVRAGTAVAAWLHHAATRAESKIQHGGVDTAVWSHERDALAVADAILGGAS